MQPTVGRIVHYHWQELAAEGEPPVLTPCAAIVTSVPPQAKSGQGLPVVSLTIFSRVGIWFQDNVGYCEEPRHNCWSWSPRIPEP